MNIDGEIQSAVQLYQARHLRQAENKCRNILQVEPGNIVVLHLLGVLLYELKEYKSSIEIIGNALKLEPDDPYLHYNYGASLHKQGLINGAKHAFQEAIRLKSDFPDAYFNLGIILEEMENLDEAILNYKFALQYNPASVDIYNNLGNAIHKKGNLEEAIFYFYKALDIKPNHIFTLNNLGTIYRGKGELDKAISFFQKATELNPDLIDSWYNLTFTLIEKNDINEAISYFHKALQGNCGHVEIYSLLRTFLKDEISHNNKINIIIAKRDRKDYLLTCLHYLNLANTNRYDSVEVYISHDDSEILDLSYFENLKIFFYFIKKEGHFNRSMLLNHSIKQARKDFDVMTIMDLDIIYDEQFFEIIKYLMNSYDYVVTTGYRLPKEMSESLKASLDNPDVIKKPGRYDIFAGPSQISINQKAYQEIIKASGREELFNEYYEGWGCEDSEIEAISIYLSQKELIKKTIMHSMWYHLWHEIEHDKPGFDKELLNKNIRHLKEFTGKYGL